MKTRTPQYEHGIGADGSLPECEERDLFPEIFEARAIALQVERNSFRADHRGYVSFDEAFDEALHTSLTNQQNELDTERKQSVYEKLGHP